MNITELININAHLIAETSALKSKITSAESEIETLRIENDKLCVNVNHLKEDNLALDKMLKHSLKHPVTGNSGQQSHKASDWLSSRKDTWYPKSTMLPSGFGDKIIKIPKEDTQNFTAIWNDPKWDSCWDTDNRSEVTKYETKDKPYQRDLF